MKYELIKFKNGDYGVRRRFWWGGYRYLDLTAKAVCYWWNDESEYFRDCFGSKKEAETAFNNEDRLRVKKKKIEILKEREII